MDNKANGNIKVWDIFIRSFHWTLAALMAALFLSEEHYLTLHAAAGYVVLFLVAGRVLWGFIGTRHARFADFVHPLGRIRAYLKDALRFRHRRTLGHNPLAGAMILLMFFFIAIAALSGVALYGAGEGAGPIASLFTRSGWRWEEPLKEIHGFFTWGTVWLAGLHVAAALIESLHFNENLVLSMVTGNKKQPIAQRSSTDENSHANDDGIGLHSLPCAAGAGGNGAGTDAGIPGGGRR